MAALQPNHFLVPMQCRLPGKLGESGALRTPAPYKPQNVATLLFMLATTATTTTTGDSLVVADRAADRDDCGQYNDVAEQQHYRADDVDAARNQLQAQGGRAGGVEVWGVEAQDTQKS